MENVKQDAGGWVDSHALQIRPVRSAEISVAGSDGTHPHLQVISSIFIHFSVYALSSIDLFNSAVCCNPINDLNFC